MIGLVIPLVLFSYYTVIVGWMLTFTVFSFTGAHFSLDTAGMTQFLYNFQDVHASGAYGGWVGFLFYGIVVALVVWTLARGISGGIEKLALCGMPILFLFALILVVRVLTLPATDVGSRWLARTFLAGLLLAGLVAIRLAWTRNPNRIEVRRGAGHRQVRT